MEVLFGIAILPLICLGVIILTAVVVIFALRRRTQTITRQVQENTALSKNGSSTDTRWTRGDMRSVPQSEKIERLMKACPACGGENAASSSSCAYCGRAL